MFVRILWLIGLLIIGTTTWLGAPYYLIPVDERPFSPMHDLYSPTGLVGHGYGIVGSLMVVVGVVLYTARKRLPLLARVGKLRDWLHFHIFLCLVGPYLILLHTTFRFGGVVAISFWSMAAVVSSGIFGRYIYAWIPKTINGRFVGAQDVRNQMRELLAQVETTTSLTSEQLLDVLWGRRRPDTDRRAPEAPGSQHFGAPAPFAGTGVGSSSRLVGVAKSVDDLFLEHGRQAGRSADMPPEITGRSTPPPDGLERRRREREPGILRAATEAAVFPITRRRRLSRFERELRSLGVVEPLRSDIVGHLEQEARIEQQLRILKPFQRAFRYWHTFHLPLAAVMFLVLGVHVAVAVAFGYTWIF